MDSQEEQAWDNINEASDGIPVLASDSDESVILLWKGLWHPYSIPELSPGLPPTPCLPFQDQPVKLLHPLVSIDQVFYCILINIFY